MGDLALLLLLLPRDAEQRRGRAPHPGVAALHEPRGDLLEARVAVTAVGSPVVLVVRRSPVAVAASAVDLVVDRVPVVVAVVQCRRGRRRRDHGDSAVAVAHQSRGAADRRERPRDRVARGERGLLELFKN